MGIGQQCQTRIGQNLQPSGSEKLNEKALQKDEPEDAGTWELRDRSSCPGGGLGCGRDCLQETLGEAMSIGKGELEKRMRKGHWLVRGEEAKNEADRWVCPGASLFSRAGEAGASGYFHVKDIFHA